jgi:hypothetical protein
VAHALARLDAVAEHTVSRIPLAGVHVVHSSLTVVFGSDTDLLDVGREWIIFLYDTVVRRDSRHESRASAVYRITFIF